jgi:hypothetical protein
MMTHSLGADRLYQFTVESQVLSHIKSALRKTLASDEDRMGLDRKVSTVRFVTESLVRHLTRLLQLEDAVEIDPAAEGKPHLAERACALQREHEQFKQFLVQLSEGVNRLSAEDQADFESFCAGLLAFLDRLDKHESAESKVLQQLQNADEGGEG